MTRILDGLRVVDCSWGTAGPQATGLLADYGADVIWVEPPGGDPTRRQLPGAASVYNRGKRSVVLDLKDAHSRELVQGLAGDADVFVQSWRPGVAERLGLGADALRASNPALVTCAISGFGPDGPYRDVRGYEAVVHAVVGTMAAQAGLRPPPVFEGLPFASTGAADLAVIGILAALLRRLDDGHGRHVETSLFDGALAFHSMLWGESDAARAAAPRMTDLSAPSRMRLITRSFLCADDEYIGVHTGAVGAFGRLMEVLGLADRIPPSETGIDMGVPLTDEQRELLEQEIHPAFAAHPRDWWVQRLMEADVCAVEHQHPTEVFDRPQPRHNGMVVTVDDPVLGPVEQVAPGIVFGDGAPGDRVPAPAPRVGEHTDAVLAESSAGSTAHRNSLPPPAPRPDTRPLLDGVRVVDLGAYYAGPYSSRLLADLGADVVKVEPVVGDQLRGIERPFFSAQAGKRSLAANLKDPALTRATEALVEWADVVHHNLRPGAAERLGLGRADVAARNPAAVYLYAPGWGSSGPQSMRQSFAPMLAGYVGASYEVAGRLNPPMPSAGNEDPGNGLLGAIAVLAALYVRRRTGVTVGCENPQVNAAMGMMSHVVRRVDSGEVVGAERLDPLQLGVGPLERLYETSDGWVLVVAPSDREVAALGTAVGLDLLADARFATPDDREKHAESLEAVLIPLFVARTTDEWIDTLARAGVTAVAPTGPDVAVLMADPEQRRTGRVAECVHPELGRVREMAVLVRVSDAAVPAHRLAPGLGEHTDEILAACGYRADETEALRARGAVR